MPVRLPGVLARRDLSESEDRVRILEPIIIGDGVRLRSHITLLDAQRKKGGDMLLKNQHDIEAEGVEGFVVCAEYLTYWHSI